MSKKNLMVRHVWALAQQRDIACARDRSFEVPWLFCPDDPVGGKRVGPDVVAIFDKPDKPENRRSPEHVVAIGECKRPDDESGVEQLKVYLDG